MQNEQVANEITQATAAAKATAKNLIPPLENGDTLTRAEFERRYHAMPHVKKAELIEGKVYMPSPVRCRNHGLPDNSLAGWLSNYCMFTPGVNAANNCTVRLDETNEPQPDVCLFIEENYGGQSSINDDDYLEGAPELVVETAVSSASHDLHEKLAAYQRNGVREYIVWVTFDRQVYWFDLTGSVTQRLAEDENGIVRSQTLPGLWLNIPALLRHDRAAVWNTLQQGIATAEHQAFVQQLAQAAQAREENG